MRDSGQFLLVIHEAMVVSGLDIAKLYDRLGFDAAALPLRQLRMEHQRQAQFWQAAEAVIGDPDLGLHLCPHMPPYRGEVLEYLMFSSPTLGEGLARAFKYVRLISDALVMRLVQDARGTRITVVCSQLDAPQLRHTEICVIFGLIHFLRGVTEQQFTPLYVALHCERRSPQAEYDAVFGCPVQFDSAEGEIWFDPAMLDHRSPRWDPDLLKLHEELAAKRLSDLHRRDLVERIRKVLSQRLELADCDLERVAEAVNMPPRRLRFELSRANTSFSQIVADFRFALARRLLSRTHEPIDNIVYLTGFSEPSTFYRAFKRWSGMTPVQFREQHGGS